MLDEKTIFWLGRRKRDINNKFGYFCRHCEQYKRQFVEWCNDAYYCPIYTRKYDYMDAAEFEARVSEKFAYDVESYFEIVNGIRTPISHNKNAFLRLKAARLAVEMEMVAEGKGPGRRKEV